MKTGRKTAVLLFALSVAAAGNLPAQRKTVAVAKVKLAPSIEAAASADGSLSSLRRIVEAIDGQMIDALNGTRKFEVIARSDLDSLMEEGGLTGAGLTPGKADYLIVPSVDDFQDYMETATFEAIGKTVQKRKIRLGMVARIYDVANGGKLVESTNFQLDNKKMEQLMSQSVRTGSFSDALLRMIAEDMSSRAATRVVDVIYPAKVLSVTGPQVMINRGDGTGIVQGQIWEVFALGEELVDPDTGESLGRSEVKVGTLRIDRVTPKFSSGTLTENFGVVKGSVVRPVK
jgi:curli biogenesis system outer membrane secretion channel CsgG